MLINMAIVRGAEVRASSVFGGWPPERIIDGQLETSWFASGQSANLGMPPWVEVVLPEAAVVTGVKVFGNRESPDGFDILQAQVEFFNSEGTLLHAELLPLAVDDFSDIDLELAAPVKGVRRVRLNSVLDQGSSPGFAEIEIIGNFKVTQAVNLAMNQAAAISASSEYSGYPAGRAVDGSSDTSWFAESGDAANLGAEPWLEIALPEPSMVTEIVIRGNREFPSGFDIFAGRLELFGEGDTLVFTETVELPDDLRDLELVLANPLLDVRRARFTSTQDESAAPGLAEFQIWGHDQSHVEWTGAQDEDWFNPLNWNLGFVPTLANDVTLNQHTAMVSTDSLYRSLVLDGARISGTLRPGTTLTWRSGQVAFPLNIGPNDRLELIGDGDKLLGADLNNQGTVVWSGGGNLAFFALGGQAHFNNHGLLDIRSDVTLGLGSVGTYALHNSGTILKSAASPSDTGTLFDTFEAIPFQSEEPRSFKTAD